MRQWDTKPKGTVTTQRPIENGSKRNITKGKNMWTNEQDEALKSHLKDGKSYSQIAALLANIKPGVSRCAISGRVMRLGWGKNSKPPVIKPKTFKPLKPDKYGRPKEIYVAYGLPVTIKDVKGCLFPIEGTDLFCNAGCKGVYCQRHKNIAYTGKRISTSNN